MNHAPHMITRRRFVAAVAAWSAYAESSPYATPYKFGELVLKASLDGGEFDSKSVDCPFVFHHGGQFWMTYVGFDGTGYQTGLASSTDLVNWRKEGCILRRDPSSPITRYNIALNWIVRQNAMRSPGEVQKIKGRFLGASHSYPNAGYEEGPAVIGLCWSRDLKHWDLDGVVLKPEDGAEWERGGLYKPCLVESDGRYFLFYNAKNPGRGWHEQTGVATSTDLKTWTRFEGNPILANGGAGAGDERFASDPCVVTNGPQWAMFYYGLDAKGRARDFLALGKDPYHFTKTGDVLIDTGASGAVDSTYAHKPSIVSYQGDLYHFYCAVSGKYPNEARGISVARSRPWK